MKIKSKIKVNKKSDEDVKNSKFELVREKNDEKRKSISPLKSVSIKQKSDLKDLISGKNISNNLNKEIQSSKSSLNSTIKRSNSPLILKKKTSINITKINQTESNILNQKIDTSINNSAIISKN
jgi:hypothetical protein